MAGLVRRRRAQRRSADSAAGAGRRSARCGSAKTGDGAWTFSPPLTRSTRSWPACPTATVDVTPVAPRTNVAVNVYDVDPDGKATMITRGAALVDAAGRKPVQLWPTDWILRGRAPRRRARLAARTPRPTSHVPTQTTVTVARRHVDLPFLPAGQRQPTTAAATRGSSATARRRRSPYRPPSSRSAPTPASPSRPRGRAAGLRRSCSTALGRRRREAPGADGDTHGAVRRGQDRGHDGARARRRWSGASRSW